MIFGEDLDKKKLVSRLESDNFENEKNLVLKDSSSLSTFSQKKDYLDKLEYEHRLFALLAKETKEQTLSDEDYLRLVYTFYHINFKNLVLPKKMPLEHIERLFQEIDYRANIVVKYCPDLVKQIKESITFKMVLDDALAYEDEYKDKKEFIENNIKSIYKQFLEIQQDVEKNIDFINSICQENEKDGI